MVEQSEGVSFERGDVDVMRVEQSAPDRLRGEREQRETDERDDEEPRIEVRAHGAFVLQRREALHEQARHALRDVLEQHLAQCALLADHLAEPERREPRAAYDRGMQPADERRDQRARILAGCAYRSRERRDLRQDSLRDERLEQPFFAAEVVVDHRGCYPSRDRDAAEAGRRDARRLEAFDSGVE